MLSFFYICIAYFSKFKLLLCISGKKWMPSQSNSKVTDNLDEIRQKLIHQNIDRFFFTIERYCNICHIIIDETKTKGIF